MNNFQVAEHSVCEVVSGVNILQLCHAEETGVGYLAYYSQEILNLDISKDHNFKNDYGWY